MTPRNPLPPCLSHLAQLRDPRLDAVVEAARQLADIPNGDWWSGYFKQLRAALAQLDGER